MQKSVKKLAIWLPVTLVAFVIGWQASDRFLSRKQANAQAPAIIVRLEAENPEHLKSLGMDLGLAIEQTLIAEMNVVRVLVPETSRKSSEAYLEELRTRPQVRWAQWDHPVKRRKTPDDPRFSNQWPMKILRAEAAWDISTGSGTNTVIAIVDGGISLTHQDLLDKIWVNAGEIAGNGIDDDQNGYIDDVNGWNAYDSNGTLPVDYHGTHVSGIAAASSDNGLQIAGVDWGSKIMLVSGSSGVTSTVLAAYGYVLAQKKLWMSSGGTKGANVVVTNSSFGIDKAKCNSGKFPAWNDIYNEMGQVGILSATATINDDVNVDQEGDVPTGCSSPYVIGVTNTTVDDEQYEYSGFGAISIDLGAPGTDVESTIPGDSLMLMTGTSMATPHVAGAIALAHSAASWDLENLVNIDPAAGALELKKLLLSTTHALPSLQQRTVTGGRLDLKALVDGARAWTPARAARRPASE